ncbi:MAG: type II toxin-antitoxin system HigB family toxin [Gemmatimonadaceae bacterium]
MRIITRARLRRFADRHGDAQKPLDVWYHTIKRATYKTPNELLRDFPKASLLGNGVTVFNIGPHRLVVHMRYDLGRVYIREVLTHAEYDRRKL